MSLTGAALDPGPFLGVVGAGVLLALGPLLWFRARQRGGSVAVRLHGLAMLTLVLSFDLVLLGAFTRLSDSGLGCPDWPGCYGHASPLGASASISAAEAALPTGPVSPGKAWIEMAHRYAATGIGVLVAVLAVRAITASRRAGDVVSPRWAIVTLLWVCLQGAFGALTVTMRLYPAIVTLHLIGGFGLLALLAIQAESYRPSRLGLERGLRLGLLFVALFATAQIVLGGWVSTNYAVLACTDFPTCQGSWWPAMDFASGFVVARPLGGASDGAYVPFAALTAIHMAHRLGALVLLPALAALAWRLYAAAGAARRFAYGLAAVAAWQAASGLGNVLLGWPLAAAIAHTAGGAALVVLLTILLVRSRPVGQVRFTAASGEPRLQAS